MLLIKTSLNWADEMHLPGFCVLPEDEFHSKMVEIQNLFEEYEEFEIWFGTNQSTKYTFTDFNECYCTKIITNEEANILNNLFSAGKLADIGFSFIYFYEQIKETISWND